MRSIFLNQGLESGIMFELSLLIVPAPRQYEPQPDEPTTGSLPTLPPRIHLNPLPLNARRPFPFHHQLQEKVQNDFA